MPNTPDTVAIPPLPARTPRAHGLHGVWHEATGHDGHGRDAWHGDGQPNDETQHDDAAATAAAAPAAATTHGYAGGFEEGKRR